MKVYKFGGASVKDAAAVKNVAKIIQDHAEDDIWVVVSAMGKTTNALESLLEAYRQGLDTRAQILEQIEEYHREVLDGLFPFSGHDVFLSLNKTMEKLKETMEKRAMEEYDKIYDTVVAFGEDLSAMILSAYLDERSLLNTWVDAREVIITDSRFREGKVDFVKTGKKVKERWNNIVESTNITGKGLLISQGFIGSDGKNTVTLGREGSDYTGAILAWSLGATELTIWKDVPGMLNADPKFYPGAERIPSLSYQEATELSYYGASVIHPKTLKPLQNKGIPLYVRSFMNPAAEGTVIHHDESQDHSHPSFIFKQAQVLISITPQDFSFIAEDNMSQIFALLSKHGLKANLMQNSALSFSICMDDRGKRVEEFMEECRVNYKTLYNQGLSLLTVRHYDEETLARLLKNREVLVEQRSRKTARFVLKGGFNLSTPKPR
jgi:aspartate kinase